MLVSPYPINLGEEFGFHDLGGHGASASFIGRVRGDGGQANSAAAETEDVVTDDAVTDDAVTGRAKDRGSSKSVPSHSVTGLFLDHHPVMAQAALQRLAECSLQRWRLDAVTLVHRVGAMVPGEVIVLVIASSAHRASSLLACEFLIDRLKTDGPFWKRESFSDGRQLWIEPRADDRVRAARWKVVS